MPHLLIKDLPRYECLIEASKRFPELDPSACEAFLHLVRAGDEAFLVVAQNLTQHQISPGRFGVLMLLAQNSCNEDCTQGVESAGMTPAELADNARVTRATMTGLVDTLERDGFVSRTTDSHDRRMMRICLTPKAHDFLEKLLPGHFRLMADLMSPLSEAERKTMVKLINKVLQHASTLNAAPVATAPAVA
ncbi:MAG: MarR family transcriptional regulator [Candidatus Didemnitutus sp.]|nr:MarR family transcriptional regulator [Candidatus Didemnitutus sp.]